MRKELLFLIQIHDKSENIRNASFRVFQHILLPKMNGDPTYCTQLLIHTDITGYVFFDLFDPVFPISLQPFFAGIPILSVPKLTLDMRLRVSGVESYDFGCFIRSSFFSISL